MRQLTSKLIAGGLSAAAVLLWWPHVFTTEGAASLLARGVLWTLVWELLVMALVPLEELVWDNTKVGQRATDRLDRAKNRVVGHESPRRRALSLAIVALVTVSVPVGLMFQGDPIIDKPAQATEARKPADVHVTKVVKVERPVQKVIQRVAAPERPSDDTIDIPADPSLRRTTTPLAPERKAATPKRSTDQSQKRTPGAQPDTKRDTDTQPRTDDETPGPDADSGQRPKGTDSPSEQAPQR